MVSNIFWFSPRKLGKIPTLTNMFSNGLVQPPTSCWKPPWWDNFTWVSLVFWGLEYRCFSNHPRLDTTNDGGWQHHARAVQWLESTDGSSHYPGRRKILMDWVGVFWLLFLLFCWDLELESKTCWSRIFSRKKKHHTHLPLQKLPWEESHWKTSSVTPPKFQNNTNKRQIGYVDDFFPLKKDGWFPGSIFRRFKWMYLKAVHQQFCEAQQERLLNEVWRKPEELHGEMVTF